MASRDKAPSRPLTTATAGAGSASPEHDLDQTWALVTGATGGIGAEFARQLADRGSNLVLTGRNTQRLADLARDLHGAEVQVLMLPVDLANPKSRQVLVDELDAEGITITTLVNNAGFGIIEDVVDTDPWRLDQMLQVNVIALTHLTRHFLPGMIAQRRGAIINVASTASYQAIPGMAAYAASKAYVRSFSNALWRETSGYGVKVLCINPGPTESGFFEVAGNASALRGRRTPTQVVNSTFEALRRGRPTVVDGPLNRVAAFANRLVPERVSTVLAQVVLKR